MRRRHFGYFDDPWYVRVLKWAVLDYDVRERLSESTDADGKPFRLIARRELLGSDLGDERIDALLELRQQAVAAALGASRGNLVQVANAARDFFAAEGICPACVFPLTRVPLAGNPPGYWWVCNECGRRWW